MSTADFLLELLSEEIPARMQARARADLARLFAEELDRRMGWRPRASRPSRRRGGWCWSRADCPRQPRPGQRGDQGPARQCAGAGARPVSCKRPASAASNCEERDGVLFAKIDQPGRSASEVLAEAVEPPSFATFHWPKSMRWGDASVSSLALGTPAARHRRAAGRGDRAGRGRRHRRRRGDGSATASIIRGRLPSAPAATMPRNCAPAMSSSTRRSARRSSATARPRRRRTPG
jgi:hypothetical protein